MSTKSPILDDLAGLMTGAMGAARAAGEEVKTAGQSRVRAMIADMDLATREEVDALKAIAVQALERVEALEEELETLYEDVDMLEDNLEKTVTSCDCCKSNLRHETPPRRSSRRSRTEKGLRRWSRKTEF